MKYFLIILLINFIGCGGDQIASNSIQPNNAANVLKGFGISESYLRQDGQSDQEWISQIQQFNVPELVSQLRQMHTHYFMISLEQNTSYVISPNSQITDPSGNTRDIVMEIAVALKPLNIPFILYIPATPVANGETYDQWYSTITEYSNKFGDLVSGWFFDGLPQVTPNFWYGFVPAAKSGNPNSLTAFNTNMDQIKYCIMDSIPYEDFTAGENNDPSCARPGILNGHLFHILTYAGSEFGHGSPRFSTDQLQQYTKQINTMNGVITWDVPYNPDGTFPQEFVNEFSAMQ